jgi:hypothetical protein
MTRKVCQGASPALSGKTLGVEVALSLLAAAAEVIE